MTNKKIFQYIAGGCFALFALIDLVDNISSGYSFPSYILPITLVAVAVGLFINQPIIAAVGAGAMTVYQLVVTIRNITVMKDVFSIAPKVATLILLFMFGTVLAYALLSLTAILRNKVVGIITGCMRLATFIVQTIQNGKIVGRFLIIAILFIVGSVMMGIVFSKSRESESPQSVGSTVTPTPSAALSPTDSIERISKLKELLDSGIITQEEFDTKKKDMLGL